MKKTLHTPAGIIERVLTPLERQTLADAGDVRAKLEIASERYTAGTCLPLKVDLIAWAIGILDKEP